MYSSILLVGVLIFGAHFLSLLFKKTYIPDVLMLTLFGLIIGPVLGYAQPSDFGQFGSALTTIALVVILFESGCSLNFKTIYDSFKSSGLLSLLSFFGTFFVVFLTAYFFVGLDFLASVMLSVILSGTSSAVIVPLMQVLPVTEKTKASLIIESAATDVLCILALFSLLEFNAHNMSFNFFKFLSQISATFVMAIFYGFVAGILWLIVVDKVKNFPNTMTTTIAWLFIVYGVTESLGYSGPIASLALGLMLNNFRSINFLHKKIFKEHNIQPLTSEELDFYRELVFLLKIFFFIYLGINFEIHQYSVIIFALVIVLLCAAIRIPIAKFLFKNETFEDRVYISMMFPKGLAAAVLASIPLANGIQGGEKIIDIVSMVVLFSIALNALLIILFQLKLFRTFYRKII